MQAIQKPARIQRQYCVGAMAIGLTLCLFGVAWGQSESQLIERGEIRFSIGKKLEQNNQLAISAWWSEASIRDRLESFSHEQKVGLFCDRRLDPEQPIEIGVNSVTTEQFLWRVAADQGWGVCRLEELYYFGPQSAVSELPLVLEQRRQEALKLRKNTEVNWLARSELATIPVVDPHRLLRELAQQSGFQIVGLEQLPQDVWRGFQTPPLSLYARLQLILTGFGKTFQRNPEGDAIKIVDWPKFQRATRVIESTVSLPKDSPLLQNQNGLRIKQRGKRFEVIGSAAAISRWEAQLVQAQTPQGGAKTFSLQEVTTTRLSLLERVASQLGVELEVPPALRATLEQRTTIAQQDRISLEELLFEILRGTGLQARVTGTQMLVE